MGYDVTNNSSIVELGYAQPVETSPLNTIVLPDSVPSPSKVLTDVSKIDNRGTITIEAVGGVPPYTYSIDGVNYQSSNVFVNVDRNNITVYIKDSLGTIITIEGVDATGVIHYVEGVTSIPIPTTLPRDPLVLVDQPGTYVPGGIIIPDVIPPDGVVLLETIPIPSFLSPTGDLIGVVNLSDLHDVDISTRNDGDVLVYNSTTNTYVHQPPTIGDLHYIHNQGVAAQVWNIIHNLGKRPSIHIEDMSGNEMIPQIIHIDNNNAQAVFGNATYSGTAYCN